MGNTCSDAAFQKQFSSLVQRTNVSHITEIGNLFSKIGGSKDTTLNAEQTKHFFSGLIELIAPQYTESKRDTLLQGWSSKSELSFTEVQQQIDQQFIKEFSLRTFPLKTHCISGVKTTMPVLVQIESPCTLETKKKPPIAIACVLDRSGSMSGDRLKFAIRSVCKVIKHMEPQDVFHLVTFDGNVKIEIENGDLTDKAALKRQVRAIHAGGSTNIGDALTKAASLLAETSLPGNGLKRLYLFGDGMANAGKITTPEGLSDLSARLNKQYDISLTTFGIGKDYNEAIMSGIAKNGAGEYYFIASSQDIPVTMSKAIHGLLNLYGTNCTLRLRGQGDGIVSKLYGKFAKHDLSQPLLLGDLYANDRKKLIFQLELSCKSSSDIEQVVCECTLTFDRIENTTTPQPITQTVTENVTLTFTRNEDLVNSTEENKTVYIAEIMQKVAGIDREIIVQLDKRDYDGAIALKQSSLDMLLAAQSYDAEGTLPKVIARVEEVLQTLKQKKDHNAMRKMVDYEACREEDDDCYGYMCRSDSDEGCYSDDDIRDYVDEISFSDDDYSDDSDCF